MSGVGHDPAVQFERHRRSQREERERRAALAAAGEADAVFVIVAVVLCPDSTRYTRVLCEGKVRRRHHSAKRKLPYGSNTTSPQLSKRACLSICIVGSATDAPCSQINGVAASLDEASEDCTRRGRRLCTPAELSGQTCCHSGCQFDGVPVWSSASCSSPSLEHRHATVSPRPRKLVKPKQVASKWTLLGAECSRHGRPVRVRHASFTRLEETTMAT